MDRGIFVYAALLVFVLAGVAPAIDNIVKPYTFTSGTRASSSEVNSNFDEVYAGANDAIDAINDASGTESTLDARLDESLNEDGTIKDYVKASAFANFSTAAASIGGTSKKVLHVDSAQSCNTLTLGKNIELKFSNGGYITVGTGKTLTINGTVSAPDNQIFAGSGTVTGLKKAIPEWFGAVYDGTTDDYTAIQASLNASKYVEFAKGRTYATDTPLAPQTGSVLSVHGTIKALAATWTGEGVIEYDGVDAAASMQDCLIEGNGSIDANAVADYGVYVKLGRRVNVNIAKVEKATVAGILMGQTGAAATSYECHINGTIVNNASGTDNGSTSVGVLYNNCSDSKVYNAVVVGYRKGFATTSSSPDISFISCHAWTINTYGPMTYGFDLSGRAKCYDCYADTPTNIGNAGPDAGITDVYGFYVNADGSMLFSSRVNLNVTYSTDNIATAVYINRASGFFGSIVGARMTASATAKFKNIVGWAGTGNMVGATILGIETDGNTYAYGYVTNEMRQALGVHGTLTVYDGATASTVFDANGRIHGSLPGYATNAAAVTGGLVAGDWYRDTDDSSIKVVY